MMEHLDPVLKEVFSHEGEITYHFFKPAEVTED